MKDAQQDVIDELRRELASSQEIAKKYEDRYFAARELVNVGAQKVEALEKELSSRVRLDDPVVKGLVEALDGYANGPGPECFDYAAAEKALAAYNAKCKEGK